MSSIKKLFDHNAKGDHPSNLPLSAHPYSWRPLQILPKEDKDFEWAARNIDWLEWQGMIILNRRSKKLLKNYKMAAGIIDKSDYIPEEEDNEYADIISNLIQDEEDFDVISLKFYPLIPIIINVLTNEFSKRNIDLSYKAIDEFSVNEILSEKKKMIEQKVGEWLNQVFQSYTEGKQISQEQVQQIQTQIMSEFPKIEEYMRNNFRLNVEKIASKFHEYDQKRFNLKDLLYNLFKDFLITSSIFVEFDMYEDDYNIVPWNPLFTFFKRYTNSPFISDGEWVGKIELMSVMEVLNKYGKYMTEEQIEEIYNNYRTSSAVSSITGFNNDGAMWDRSIFKPGDGVPEGNSMDFNRMMYWYTPLATTEEIVNKLYLSSEDAKNNTTYDLVKVTKVYWKTLKRVGVVTKVDPFTKEKISFLVEDGYKPSFKPKYDKRFSNEKSEKTLIDGEHIEWYWIDEVWGGIKIGPNVPTWYNQNKNGFGPIYIGINKKEPGPIDYEFRTSENIFDAKLPVTGIIYTERNTIAHSIVDIAKPYQIAYNIVNNQIMDMLLDEIGSVVLIDKNTIPKTNLEEDGGANPLVSMYNYMKKYKILPVDTSIDNTNKPINFNQFQQLVLEHSQRISTRIQLAQFFQQKLYESIGLSPERLGRPTSEYQSGRSAEINVVNSYSVTEKYFTLFGDLFLPKFHEMRNNLLFWYISQGKMKGKAISYFTDKFEREFIYSLNEEDAILRTFSVFPTTDISYKLIIDQIKQMILNNPNLGVGLSEVVRILDSNNRTDIMNLVEKIENKQMQLAQLEQQKEQEKLKTEAEIKKQQMELAAKLEHGLLDKKLLVEREKIKANLFVNQLNAARYLAAQDVDASGKSDFIEFYEDLLNKSDIENKKIEATKEIKEKELELKKEEIQAKKEIKDKEIRIAQIYESNGNKQNKEE